MPVKLLLYTFFAFKRLKEPLVHIILLNANFGFADLNDTLKGCSQWTQSYIDTLYLHIYIISLFVPNRFLLRIFRVARG